MRWKRLLGSNIKQVLFVFGAFFLMVLIGCLSVSTVIQREVRTSVSIALKETEKTIKSYLREPQIAFTGIYVTLQEMLDRGDDQKAIYDYLTRMGAALGGREEGVPGFTGVYGFLREEFVDSIDLNPGSDFIPQQRPWYQAAIRSENATYTAPYVDIKTGRVVISLAREVYGKKGDYFGVLSLDVDLSWLFTYANSLQLAEGGYGMILNQYLYVITHPDGRFINRPVEDLGGDYAGIASTLRTLDVVSDMRIRDYNGAKVVVFFREIGNGWKIGVVMPRGSYFAELYRTAAFLAGLGVILSTLLSLLLLRLSAAKMQSDEDNRAKSSFLAMMSHEIRTPLNAIIGLSDIQLQNDLPEATRADLETIHASGSNLLGIINDILDFSKIDAGAFTLSPSDYDLPSLVNDTLQMNAVHIDSRPIAFVVNVDPLLPARVRGDELRLKQILNNLLSNAFKYTREGAVTFTVRYEPRDESGILHFTVADTGAGIRKEDMPRLFSEYTRLNMNATRKIEGTGLGLVIAKGLAENMGGGIWAESEYGKGSTFGVSIPQAIVDATPIGSEMAENLEKFRFAEERRGKRKTFTRLFLPKARVLVVDDIPTNLDVARGMLVSYHMRVDCAGSGREAVEHLRDASIRYDAVFMDHMMPGMDGVEATRIIRNEIGTHYAQTVPIIALTANALSGNEDIFLSKGFNAFVPKPIDPVRLDAVVRRWVAGPDAAQSAEPGGAESVTQNKSRAAADADDAFSRICVSGLDLDEARMRYGGDWEIYAEVLRSYAKHTPKLLADMAHPSESALAAYAVVVHGLKGSSWGVSAKAVGDAAAELERAAKAGDFAAVVAGSEACLSLARMLVADINALFDESGAAADEPGEQVDMINEGELRAMIDYCDQFNAMEMERLLATMEKRAYSSPADADFILRLRELLDNLDYDELRTLLEQRLAA